MPETLLKASAVTPDVEEVLLIAVSMAAILEPATVPAAVAPTDTPLMVMSPSVVADVATRPE